MDIDDSSSDEALDLAFQARAHHLSDEGALFFDGLGDECFAQGTERGEGQEDLVEDAKVELELEVRQIDVNFFLRHRELQEQPHLDGWILDAALDVEVDDDVQAIAIDRDAFAPATDQAIVVLQLLIDRTIDADPNLPPRDFDVRDVVWRHAPPRSQRTMGKISDADFADIGGGYRARAMRVLRQLDQQGADYKALVEKELKARLGATTKDDA